MFRELLKVFERSRPLRLNERLMRANSDGKHHVIFIPKCRLLVCFFPAQAGNYLILFVTLAANIGVAQSIIANAYDLAPTTILALASGLIQS
jgi:hypothetical protein